MHGIYDNPLQLGLFDNPAGNEISDGKGTGGWVQWVIQVHRWVHRVISGSPVDPVTLRVKIHFDPDLTL